MNWMKARGKALTTQERIYLRDSAITAQKIFKTPLIVNIGVFRCASMYCLRAGAARARIIGIDIQACSIPIDKNLRAEFIIKDSRACHTKVPNHIHLLFIDGDHHYDVVKADVNNWTPKVAPGGVVIFHDFNPLPKDLVKIPYLEGVRRAVSAWASTSGWISMKAPNSLAAFRRPL